MSDRIRYKISDSVWNILNQICPEENVAGGIAQENRLFINAVFLIMRTGAPWPDLPPDYGGVEQHT